MMRNDYILLIVGAAFSLLSIVAGIIIGATNGDPRIFVFKIVFICLLSVVNVFIWISFIIFRDISSSFLDIANKYRDMQRILLDIRDGTKRFYSERRQSARHNLNFKTLITSDAASEFVKTLDISYEGAMLELPSKLDPGKIVALELYLPLFAQPIRIKAKVIRCIIDVPFDGGPTAYKTGVSFIDMDDISKKELIETLDILGEKK